MNETIWYILKSGFPLLLLVVYLMILVNIWRKEADTNSQKWKWTGVLLVPPFIAALIFWGMSLIEVTNIPLAYILTGLILILPVTGIFIWLVKTR